MTAGSTLEKVIAFGDFLRAVHAPTDGAWRPYPWQERFAEACASPDHPPPSWVVAPTGAGKTVVVDALVWALAAQANVPHPERTASTRIVWAIDRRILVDEVHEHAEGLAQRLHEALDARDDRLHGVAVRLLHAAGTDVEEALGLDRDERDFRGIRPLVATRWRGGLPPSSDLLSPFQPQVITSTVGQIGSRLLFRGYGVGHRSQALSTGLAATDTTICLDEAHLAIPFRETVDAIRTRRLLEQHQLRTADLHLVTLTATPPPEYEARDAIHLDDADRERLGARWTGSKSLELREATGPAVPDLVAATEALLDSGSKVVACIANRVLTARSARDKLAKSLSDRADVFLLMGPQRPEDRQRQLDEIGDVVFRGAAPTKPIVVVATQTIEVGLDADFDGMVTQSASASALTQRLGRLNRSGRRPGRAIVIRDEGFFLYEHDEPGMWDWLHSRPGAPEEIDVSVKALAGDYSRPADRRGPPAAALTDAIVRQLTQTSPRPAPLADPDIEQLLGGIGSRPARDVQIVWRCDLRMDDASDAATDYRDALLKLVRPRPEESLTVSKQAARSFLAALSEARRARARQLNDADVDGGTELESATDYAQEPAFAVVRGREVLQSGLEADLDNSIVLADIHPGDTIVLPTTYGGADQFGLYSHATTTEDVLPDLDEGRHGDALAPIRLSWETVAERLPWPPPEDTSGEAEQQRRRNRKHWSDNARRIHQFERRMTPGGHGKRGEGTSLTTDRARELLRESNALGLQGVCACLDRAGDDTRWRLRRVDPVPASLEEPDGDGPSLDSTEGEQEPGPAADESSEPYEEYEFERWQAAAWVLVPVAASREGRDETSARSAPPTVASHTHAVRARLRRYLAQLQLPDSERAALELATLAHDLGKLDPRFQDYLWGGVASPDSEPLAKSTFGDDPAADYRARMRSGRPSGFRHEARSVAILKEVIANGAVPPELSAAFAPLALFLTGTHHGAGRPLWSRDSDGRPPAPFEADMLGIRGRASGRSTDGWLDGEWLQIFFDLQDRYGPWMLAYLEAVFATADRTVSREGG